MLAAVQVARSGWRGPPGPQSDAAGEGISAKVSHLIQSRECVSLARKDLWLCVCGPSDEYLD